MLIIALNGLFVQENTHRLTLRMCPDEAFLEKQAKAEEEKLQEKISVLTDSDRKEIYQKGNIFTSTHLIPALLSLVIDL